MSFVVHDYHRCVGPCRYVVEQANRFQEQHEVHVFAHTWALTGSEKIQFHKVSALTNWEILKVLTFILPRTFLVPNGKFDIVHSKGLCGLRHDITTSHCIQAAWLKGLVLPGISWVEAQAAAMEVDSGFEVLDIPESTRSSIDVHDFAVQPLGHGIGYGVVALA